MYVLWAVVSACKTILMLTVNGVCAEVVVFYVCWKPMKAMCINFVRYDCWSLIYVGYKAMSEGCFGKFVVQSDLKNWSSTRVVLVDFGVHGGAERWEIVWECLMF